MVGRVFFVEVGTVALISGVELVAPVGCAPVRHRHIKEGMVSVSIGVMVDRDGGLMVYLNLERKEGQRGKKLVKP
jgi:hypothetical protein